MRRVLWIALILIGAGYFGPWVAHKAAGLVLSADDLGEWLKFLPGVLTGQLGITRELFYVPIWLTSIGLGLMAGRIKAWPWKIAVLALSLVLVFTPLPKYPELLTAFRTPEFIATFWITIASMLTAIALAFWGSRIPDRAEAMLWIAMGLAAATLAPLHFVKVAPEIDRLYHFSIGWGIVAEVIGGVLMAIAGGVLLANGKRPLRLRRAPQRS